MYCSTNQKMDAMKKTCKALRNHMKVNDWNFIRRDFDVLNEQLEKAALLVKKDGVPDFYFQTLTSIDKFLKEVCNIFLIGKILKVSYNISFFTSVSCE